MAPGYLVTADDRTGTEYTTASGYPLPDEGQRTVQVITASGKRATMKHRVVNVRKPPGVSHRFGARGEHHPPAPGPELHCSPGRPARTGTH
eukprot:3182671-Heterocapsa_arctica.AAC.1